MDADTMTILGIRDPDSSRITNNDERAEDEMPSSFLPTGQVNLVSDPFLAEDHYPSRSPDIGITPLTSVRDSQQTRQSVRSNRLSRAETVGTTPIIYANHLAGSQPAILATAKDPNRRGEQEAHLSYAHLPPQPSALSPNTNRLLRSGATGVVFLRSAGVPSSAEVGRATSSSTRPVPIYLPSPIQPPPGQTPRYQDLDVGTFAERKTQRRR